MMKQWMLTRRQAVFGRVFAVLLTFAMMVCNVPPIATPAATTKKEVICIKSGSTGEYLYAHGTDVLFGAMDENAKSMYQWELVDDNGSYNIRNVGTGTYMCIQGENGIDPNPTVFLYSTTEDNWSSENWVIEEAADGSKKIKSNWTTGYVYAEKSEGDNKVHHGYDTNKACTWIFETSEIEVNMPDLAPNQKEIVYIQSPVTGEYLYAESSEDKAAAVFGEMNEANKSMFQWEILDQGDGSYWIMNFGTKAYICIEGDSGDPSPYIRLFKTIYEVWGSSKWTIEESSKGAVIKSKWTTGHIYSKENSEGKVEHGYAANEDSMYFNLTREIITYDDPSLVGAEEMDENAPAKKVSIPEENEALDSIGATMPYVRYDSDQAALGSGAEEKTSTDFHKDNVASQASNQSYIALAANNSYVEWTIKESDAGCNGVTIRYTLPDNEDGTGMEGSLDVYVNDTKVKTVDLTSYYAWQYLTSEGSAHGHSSEYDSLKEINDAGIKNYSACFAFDEVHFLLDNALKTGDKIRIQKTDASDIVYGVDFLELEKVGAPIEKPENALSVADYRGSAKSDLEAIQKCIQAAQAAGKDVYIPAGTYKINEIWKLDAHDMKISGAGIWYTNIQFTNPAQAGGGIEGQDKTRSIEFSDMYINSRLRSRYEEAAAYKAFMGTFGGGSWIHDIWEEHFECGFWMADYGEPMAYSDNLRITNSRIRNNFADGVNFCQGTCNAAVYNCSVRNNGDDGLAVWNNDYLEAKDALNNVFAYNTIEFTWRAGAIAIYGGDDHKIYNNYIRDSFMASGIHLNTNFGGYKFKHTNKIRFANNIIITSGSSYDIWDDIFSSVDIIGNVRNTVFENTYIYDSQHDGVRIGDNVSGIQFKNLHIYGTGLDGTTSGGNSVPHRGLAVFNRGGSAKMDVAIEGLYLKNIMNTKLTMSASEGGKFVINEQNNEGDGGYEVPLGTNQNLYASKTVEEIDRGDYDDDQTIAMPDVVVTDVKWTPASPKAGDKVVFSVTVKNIGKEATPEGTITGVNFLVDDKQVAWSDTYTKAIQPNEEVRLTANNGPDGDDNWIAAIGEHEVCAWVNDNGRYKEENTVNNQKTVSFTVAERGYDSGSSSGNGNNTASGNDNTANTPADDKPTHKHTYETAYSVIKDATATEEGTKGQKCTECGEYNPDTLKKIPVYKVKLNATEGVLQTGKSTDVFKATVNEGDRIVKWSTSNKKIAVVNKKGVITAKKKAGTVTITVTSAKGAVAKIQITVQKEKIKTESVSVTNVTKNKLTMKKGKKYTLVTDVNPITSSEKVKFTSSDKKIVTVNKKGRLTAKKKGKAVITVTSGSENILVNVTVK